VTDVALATQLLIGGVKVSRFEEAGRDYDILVRADEASRSSPEALRQLTVASSKLGTVPLLDVVDLKKEEGPSKIERFARQRRVMFLANSAPGVGSGEVGTELEKEVAAMKLPKEYTFEAFGQSKEIKRTGQAFMFAFGLSFLFMYLILAAQFESWLHPITILLSLPLTVPFALVSLLILKSSLDIFTMLGILVLFGVVKKNSILQIAHIIQLRAEGHSRFDAIMHGNRDRLRPILMTTFAFVAGMFPLVTTHGIGNEFNRATAGPVFIGQLLSLLLTLLATPVAYTFFDDASGGMGRAARWLGRTLFGWRPQTPAETGADEIMGPPPVTTPSNGHTQSRAEAAE
jgi:hydrophobic/amphiphilic exporter-1 (mainly G- bacteria), HAE1 family